MKTKSIKNFIDNIIEITYNPSDVVSVNDLRRTINFYSMTYKNPWLFSVAKVFRFLRENNFKIDYDTIAGLKLKVSIAYY